MDIEHIQTMSAPCPTFGFVVAMKLRPNAAEAERATLVDEFIDLLERHGLVTGDGKGRAREFVVSREGSQATDADRALVREWAAQQAHRAEIDVGDLVDL